MRLVWMLGLLSLIFLSSTRAVPEQLSEELLVGWQGETYKPEDENNANKKAGPRARRWIETISWNPRAYIYHGLMTHDECDHLVAVGSKRISRSMVVDSATGQAKLDPIRTSYGAVFGRGEDPVIATIEERIAEWTHLPAEYGENMQILKYVDGQQYDHHWDWFGDPVHHADYLADGNRYATVVMYLADVEEGGETYVPLAVPIDEKAQVLPNASKCVTSRNSMGLAVRPIKGDALLFFDMVLKTGKGDHRSLHASCPTLKGTKWTATKWIHDRRYGGAYDALAAASRCRDIEPNCAKLVKGGMCYKDMEHMVGPNGYCRKSCEDCVPCPAGDIICERRNLRRWVSTKIGVSPSSKS